MTFCEREDEILDAVQSGHWTPEAELHVAECALCRDLAAATAALVEPASLAGPSLPSASFLWWKGQIQAQRNARQRLERPLAMAEWAGLAGTLVALGLLASPMVALALAGIAAPIAWYWQRSHQSE